ncbi:MAG: PQQ-binding-like beta-propeller repeat protein [Pseudomonadota bacterium]
MRRHRALTLLLFLLVPETGAADDGEIFTLAPAFTHAFPQPLRGPVLARGGRYVAVLEDRVEGVDPKTGLTRFEGDKNPLPRRVAVLPHGVLFVGEHLRLFDPADGRLRWDYPMNCRPGDCNVDVLTWDDDRILVAGFGASFDQVMLLDARTGRDAWPDWVPTANARFGRVAGDRVTLVCDHAARLVQVVDIPSRRVLHTAPAPKAGLKPQRVWFGDGAVAVLGRLDGNASLAMIPLDGAEGASFKITAGADDEGLWAWPDAGRFSMVSRAEGRTRAWFMDVATRKAAGSLNAAGGATLLPGPEGIVVAEAAADRLTLTLHTPAAGASAWRLELPLPGARVWRQGARIVVASAGTPARIVILEAADGSLVGLGDLPPGPAAAATWMSEPGEGLAAVAAGQTLLVFEKRPVADLVTAFRSALDAGDEGGARSVAGLLAPFQDGLAVAREMATELRRRHTDRLLQAVEAGRWAALDEDLAGLLRGCAPTDRHCAPDMAAAANTLVSLRRFGAEPARCDVAALRILGDWAMEYLEAGAAPGWVAGLVLELAASLADRGALEDGEALRGRLLADPVRAAAADQDHLTKIYRLYGLRGALQGARDAVTARDWTAAAKALKAFAAAPQALALFDPYYEPLMEALSVDLLPAEMLPERVPGILAPLEKELPLAIRPAISAAEGDACVTRCDRAMATCPHPCAAPGACDAVYERCLEGCLDHGARWRLPKMRVDVKSEGFLNCR